MNGEFLAQKVFIEEYNRTEKAESEKFDKSCSSVCVRVSSFNLILNN